MFREAEAVKNRAYKKSIRQVEQADFNPLVFTCTGGMAPQCSMVIKRLAQLTSEKQNLTYSVVSGWLHCCLSFALLRTTITCIRATRRKRFAGTNNITLAVSEAQIEC